MQSRNEHFIDLTVFDREGESVGTVTDVISDPDTLEPRYLTVRTKFLERLTGEHLLPIAVVDRRDDGLTVPFEGQVVRSAPTTRDHMAPRADREREIAAHYGG